MAFLSGSARRVCKTFQERRPWADLIAAHGFSFVEAVDSFTAFFLKEGK
jgi:hypothetical protein